MRKKENIKELLLRLMSRHKAVMSDSDGDETVATEKFPADEELLAEMCRLVGPRPALPGGSRVRRVLISWFVPRNIDDVDCFARRYHVWQQLPYMVTEVLRKRKEKR